VPAGRLLFGVRSNWLTRPLPFPFFLPLLPIVPLSAPTVDHSERLSFYAGSVLWILSLLVDVAVSQV